MSKFGHIVPWYNSDEWHKVYEDLSDSCVNKQTVLKTLLAWKARCPSLPSGIESTLSLLQVQQEDVKESTSDDRLIRLAYSSAIMRFVNHMLDTVTVKRSSLYRAAKNLGVPDWVVDLRHETAHSNNLPNLTLLQEACVISLEWLQQNYWEKYKPNIQNYISGQKDEVYGDVTNISVLFNLSVCLGVIAHPSTKIKKVLQIQDIEMRDLIFNDVQDLFKDNINLSNLTTLSIKSLIAIIDNQSKHVLKIPDVSKHVNEVLLGEDSIFLCRELLYFFSNSDFYYKNRLHSSYVQCFEVILTVLHSNELLLEFILALIKITQNSEIPLFKARLAALWVSEILAALKRHHQFSKKLEQMFRENRKTMKKSDLKKLYHEWFPGTQGRNLMLDIQKPVPPQLMDVNYIQPIIAAYNPYLIYFIKNLLNLIVPSISSTVADKVYKLAELIATPEKFPAASSAIYTVDDIKANTDYDEHDDVIICEVIKPEGQSLHSQETDTNKVTEMNGIWKLASENHDWSSCPIGQLPWQQQLNTSIETNDN